MSAPLECANDASAESRAISALEDSIRNNTEVISCITKSSDSIIKQSGNNSLNLTSVVSEKADSWNLTAHELSSDLSATLVSTASKLERSISSIAESISSASDGVTFKTALFTFFIALIGSSTAFIFNWLHWRIIREHEHASAISNALVNSIKDFEDASMQYWLNGCNRNDQLLEIKMKSLHQNIRTNSRILKNARKGKRYIDSHNKIDIFVNKVFDLATGGDFESNTREKDKLRAAKVSTQCAQAVSIVSQLS